MKIAILTHNVRQDNGAGVFSRRFVEGMRAQFGCDIRVLTTVPSGEENEYPILFPNRLKLLFHFLQIRKILAACDIIHALDAFPYGVIASLATRGMRKKIIITAIGSGSIIPLYRKSLRWLLCWSYREANCVTAISRFTKQEILKKISDLRIRVINHGVDADFFGQGDGSAYDVSRLRPYILGVGQLRWRKGYHFSIRAFAHVAREFPDMRYVIVGKKYKDDYYERLQKIIDELNLRQKVFILEDVDTKEKLRDIYHGAELFCLFSQNMGHDVEGFGLVFLEAAAAGLPVVGSKNCGIDDAIEEGKNGLLVPTRSSDDFAKAILTIIHDQELKKRMGEQSLEFAQKSMWKKRIAEYFEVYEESFY